MGAAMPGDKAAATMQVPPGFKVTLFAGEPDVMQPIAFAIDDRARVWVAEAYGYPIWSRTGNDRVIILEDSDNDGRFDRRTVFYEKLNYVTGIEIGFGGVWILSSPDLLFIPDRDGNGVPDSEPQVVLSGFGHQGIHNLANGFTWGPDGWLYGGHGGSSYSRLGPPGSPEDQLTHFDGGIWRYHHVKKKFEGIAEGTTNPWGIDFNENGDPFISNCVLPHLYHVIPGAHYERRRPSPLSTYAYKTIPTIADHRHWAGAKWEDSRGGSAEQLALGGGHAHSGAMVYRGGLFPQEYWGKVYMINIHGRRANSDALEPFGSGYKATHSKDLFIAKDPHFLGVGIQYGPDGSVFVSDWNDGDECHTRRPDRQTGRIFKISYGNPQPLPKNLALLPDNELLNLHEHKNAWFARHSRRILQERGEKFNPAPLKERFEKASRFKLEYLWTLHAVGALGVSDYAKLLEAKEEQIRRWGVQLSVEHYDQLLVKFEVMAKNENSAVVRLALASAAQKIPLPKRWTIMENLLTHRKDAADPNIPAMLWYAAEPLAKVDPARALKLVRDTKIPDLRELMARRVASVTRRP